MELYDFLSLIRRKRKTLFGIMAIFILMAGLVIGLQKFKYSATSQLLVVQEHEGSFDAYSASKSSEHLSTVLASVIRSNSFFTKVTTTSPSINTAYFGDTPKKQIKEWGKTVRAQVVNDSGIIVIKVYHPNRSEAEKIAGAVNYVMMTQHSAYDGAGEAVKVRLIDQPVTSTFPDKPNIPLTLGLAIVLGFLSALIYIYLLPTKTVESLQTNTVPHYPLRTQAAYSPAEQLQSQPAGYHHVRKEQPHGSEFQRSSHDYGNHAHVALRNHPELFGDEEDRTPPDTIIDQGNMKNILD